MIKKTEKIIWRKIVRSAFLSNMAWGAAVSLLVMMIAVGTEAASLEGVDGEHGMLTVTGELVDSPCRLSMDTRDQTVDLGTLASADLEYLGARSQPVIIKVRLEGCLLSSGGLYDVRTGTATVSESQPVVDVSFMAPSDLNDASLMKLNGVSGIALRITDSRNNDIRLGGHGVPLLLTPGDNTLSWTVVAERVAGPMVPGAFKAITDFKLSYD